MVAETTLRTLELAGTVRETLLYDKRSSGFVQCHECQRRCMLSPGKLGHCHTKINREGSLLTLIYGLVSSAHADPIEKKPVFHYKPGSVCYSVGSLGCNFRCVFCQNWQIAYADPSADDSEAGRYVSPEALIDLCGQHNAAGLAWTYNEPGIWLNYTLDSAKLAKSAGLYTVYVTNGYATPEHLDTIGPYLNAYRVDIKSMEDNFYQRLIGITRVAGILEVAKRAREKWGMHVEVVTNIIPGWNDREDNLRSLARWIRDNIGELTPWHVTRFFPYGDLAHLPPTPIETLENAVRLGQTEGLKFVYLGNATTRTGENTYCPIGGELAIARSGYSTRIVAVKQDGTCRQHGADLNFVM